MKKLNKTETVGVIEKKGGSRVEELNSSNFDIILSPCSLEKEEYIQLKKIGIGLEERIFEGPGNFFSIKVPMGNGFTWNKEVNNSGDKSYIRVFRFGFEIITRIEVTGLFYDRYQTTFVNLRSVHQVQDKLSSSNNINSHPEIQPIAIDQKPHNRFEGNIFELGTKLAYLSSSIAAENGDNAYIQHQLEILLNVRSKNTNDFDSFVERNQMMKNMHSLYPNWKKTPSMSDFSYFGKLNSQYDD